MQSNKAWTAALGTALTGLLITYAEVPNDVAVAIGTAVTAVLVWLVPNARPR